MKKMIMIMFGMIVMLSSFTLAATIISDYTTIDYLSPTTQRVCTGNTCTMTLYGGARFMDNGSGEYKDFTDVVDFEYVNDMLEISWYDNIVYLKPYIEVAGEEYNFSDIPSVSLSDVTTDNLNFINTIIDSKYAYYFNHTMDTKLNNKQSINEKVTKFGYRIIKSNTQCYLEEYSIICEDVEINFFEAINKQNLTMYNKIDSKTNEVTEISLKAENLGTSLSYIDPTIIINSSLPTTEDMYYRDGSLTYGSQIKFNITNISSDYILNTVTLFTYMRVKTPGIDADLTLWRISNQSWVEATPASEINSQTKTNQTVGTLPASASNWAINNITEIFKTDHDLNNDFTTIRFEDPDYSVGTITAVVNTNLIIGSGLAEEVATFENSKNNGGTGQLPYLNITYSTGASDTTFSVALPSEITTAIFNTTSSTAKNISPDGQNSTHGFFFITNEGNVNMDFYFNLNLSLPAEIQLKADLDNDAEDAIQIYTNFTKIVSSLASASTQFIWLWSDFFNAPEQNIKRTLNISVNETV